LHRPSTIPRASASAVRSFASTDLRPSARVRALGSTPVCERTGKEMTASGQPPVTFFSLVNGSRPPSRADRSVAGTIPTRAFRYCDAITSASGFGWWIYNPLEVQLIWTGDAIYWRCEEQPEWLELRSIQLPGLIERFNRVAPLEAADCVPPFLAAFPEPGLMQVWTGTMALTQPNWSLLVRSPANYPKQDGYTAYEGIIETDEWFGPLFINLRLTRTDTPITLRTDIPLMQIQPIPRMAYADSVLNAPRCITSIDAWSPEDWERYLETVVRPNNDAGRPPGAYAVAVRRRRKSSCPFSGNRQPAALGYAGGRDRPHTTHDL
jgi:hypothetical protein